MWVALGFSCSFITIVVGMDRSTSPSALRKAASSSRKGRISAESVPR